MNFREWLLDLDEADPQAALEEAAEARAMIESLGRELDARSHLDPGYLPLSITKGLAGDVQLCEGLALARRDGHPEDRDADADAWPLLRGRALDGYVRHVLFAGAVADPLEDLASVWQAQGLASDAELIRSLPPGDPDGRGVDLMELAAAAGALRTPVEWVPRVEVRMGERFGECLRLAGRVDVVLGGPGTNRPTVLLEVKSAQLHSSHHAELHHYALLCALRHGSRPAALAAWYPDGTVMPLHVPGAAISAAVRVIDTAWALVELAHGRPPRLSPGPHCGWCPAAAVCLSCGLDTDAATATGEL